jgi:hypothetical protein
MFEWTNQLDMEELGDYVIKDKNTSGSITKQPIKQEEFSSGSEYTTEESDSEGQVEYESQSD